MPIQSKTEPTKISASEWQTPRRGVLEGKPLNTGITLLRYIDAEGGDVVLGPANISHGYQNLGPGRLESLDIHFSPEWIQFNLAGAWDKSSVLLSAESKIST